MRFVVWIASVVVGWSLSCLAQGQQGELVKPVKATEAKSLIGTNAVIVGKIAEVNRTDKIVRLNFEEKYPKQPFTAVIFPASFELFTNVDSLVGKTVEVGGKVAEFRGRPQIVLTGKSQLRVVEPAKADAPIK